MLSAMQRLSDRSMKFARNSASWLEPDAGELNEYASNIARGISAQIFVAFVKTITSRTQYKETGFNHRLRRVLD